MEDFEEPKRIPRYVHIPWFAVTLTGVLVTGYGQGCGPALWSDPAAWADRLAADWLAYVFFVLFMAWLACSRCMR